MEVRLKVLAGSSAGQEVKLPAPKFFIGRAEDCHLRPKSDLISRHHCVVVIEEGFVAVRDLGSRNGTFVNDEQVAGERELHAGDCLRVGPLQFEVAIEAPVAKKRPKVTSVKDAAARTAQGAPTTQGEEDVTQWLTEEVPPEMVETREIEASDTEEINLKQTMMLPPADVETKSPEADEPHPTPPKPAKLPKSTSGDSGKAAADVLRKFFQRR